MASISSRANVWAYFRQFWFNILFTSVIGAAWFCPLSLNHSTLRVFNHALKLEANRREPPRLAFNLIDSLQHQIVDKKPKVTVNLNDVLLKSSEEESRTFLFRRLHPSSIWLNQMVISRAEFEGYAQPVHFIASADGKSKVIVRGPQPVSEVLPPANEDKFAGPVRVRMQEGLYVGDGVIEMSLESKGHSRSIGYADTKSGFFNPPDLSGEDLAGATVIAKIRAGTGEVIGRGHAPASTLIGSNSPSRSPQGETETPGNKIDLHQFNNHLAGTVGDFGQLADNSFMPNQNRTHQLKQNFRARSFSPTFSTTEDLPASGHFEMSNVANGSTSLFRFEKSGYQASLFVSQSGQEQQIPLLTKSVATALLVIAAEQRNHSIPKENKSIIWGRAISDQVPMAGIRIASDLPDESQVVYFNQMMLPDPKLSATSANGFFAILHLPDGMHEIQAFQGNLFFGFANAVSEADTVTPVAVLATKAKALRAFSTVSAFDQTPQDVELKLQSLTETLSTESRHQYFLPDNDVTGFAKVHPQDPAFADEETTYNSSSDSVVIPLVPVSWLESIHDQFSDQLLPGTGVVVGFVDSAAYKVYLPHETDNKNIISLYFDAKGSLVDAPVDGGGFALLNVPQGIESLVVVDQVNGTAWSQVYNSNNSAIFIATPNF